MLRSQQYSRSGSNLSYSSARSTSNCYWRSRALFQSFCNCAAVVVVILLSTTMEVNGQHNRTYSSVQCKLNTERTLYIQYSDALQQYIQVNPESRFQFNHDTIMEEYNDENHDRYNEYSNSMNNHIDNLDENNQLVVAEPDEEDVSLPSDNPIFVVRQCWCSQYFGRPTVYCPEQFDACRVDGEDGPITCFTDTQGTNFVRGFWFICLFWFVALMYAFFFSEQGSSARSYIQRKLCLNGLFGYRALLARRADDDEEDEEGGDGNNQRRNNRRTQRRIITEEEHINNDINRMIRNEPDRVAWLLRSAFLRQRSREQRSALRSLQRQQRQSRSRRRQQNQDEEDQNNNEQQQQEGQNDNQNNGTDAAAGTTNSGQQQANDSDSSSTDAPASSHVMQLTEQPPQPAPLPSGFALQLKITRYVDESRTKPKERRSFLRKSVSKKADEEMPQAFHIDDTIDDSNNNNNDGTSSDDAPQAFHVDDTIDDSKHTDAEMGASTGAGGGGSSAFGTGGGGLFDDDDEVSCAICLIPFEHGDLIGNIPCGHLFHKDCLKTWLKRRNHCPLCQQADLATLTTTNSSATDPSQQQQAQGGGRQEAQQDNAFWSYSQFLLTPLRPLPPAQN